PQKLDVGLRDEVVERADLVRDLPEIVIPVQEHVVAVLVKRRAVRRLALPLRRSKFSANETVALEQRHLVAALGQPQGGRQASHPRTDDRYLLHVSGLRAIRG